VTDRAGISRGLLRRIETGDPGCTIGAVFEVATIVGVRLQLMAMYFHAHARRTLGGARTIDGVSLSPREYECLEWAAQGKSAWAIGRILGISRHTAATHIENAKAKLGVRTIVQAVARLMA
jgi:DNA-binding CsgD family transcriptional regulator